MEKRNMKLALGLDKESVRGKFTSRAFRAGGYSALAAFIVVAIAAAAVLLVGKLPSTITKLDVTANGMFSLSDKTKQLVGGLAGKVDIYLIVQSGNEDETLVQLLDRYKSLSPNVTVTRIDPVVSPNFLSQYGVDATMQDNSLLVVSGKRSQHVPYSDIFETDYSSYYATGNVATSFAGESAVTSAIDYVTRDSLPKAYMLTGHGEPSFITSMQSEVKRENIDLAELSFLTEDAVPEDCACLVINSPKADLSAGDKDKIAAYLAGGGRLLLITDYTQTAMPNLAALMEHYGVTKVDGIVVEGDANHSIRSYYHYLLPDINSHAITTPLRIGNYYVLMPMAQGLVVSDGLRDTLNVTKLLTTSDRAYSKLAGANMQSFDREEGDIDGPFALAVAISETVDGGETKIVWATTSQLMLDDVNDLVAGADRDFLLNAFGWMCEREETIAIRAKDMSQAKLTVPTSAAVSLSLALVALLPLLFIAAGIAVVVWRKRR